MGPVPISSPIGDKHILLFFSHTNGGQYFLGDYTDQQFQTVCTWPVESWPGRSRRCSCSIRRIRRKWRRDQHPEHQRCETERRLGPDHVRSPASDAGDGQAASDRADRRTGHRCGATIGTLADIVLAANQEIVLDRIQGNTLELAVEIDPQLSRWVQLNVLRSPNAEEQTSITFYNFDRQLTYWYHAAGELVLDGSRSSVLPDVWLRPPERAVLKRDGELLKLRVFIDRSVVEVFANGRQYLAMRVYPGRQDSVGVSLRAQGQDAVLNSLDAWQLQSIWP